MPIDKARSYTGHAHPCSKNHRPAKIQPMSDIFADIDVEVILRGLAGENRHKVTDVYCPEVRRSPPTDYQHINHLDVVSCWKGLSFRQAREVAQWEILFKNALEDQLRDIVLRVTEERAYRPYAGESTSQSCRNLDPVDTGDRTHIPSR